MFQKIIYFIFIIIFFISCSKKPEIIKTPALKEESFRIYEEGITNMAKGDFFYASKKFSEAESIMPQVEFSAKAALMSSYCLYIINFYPEAKAALERYAVNYPADKNIAYAEYLLAIILYEQILDEKKDIFPLTESKKQFNLFIKKYPNTEYALDLKFKLDLIDNQLAAKELYVAKYYIETKKWIPAINRLKAIIKNYSETIFIEEALHRLVEVYYRVGLEKEATSAAALLGYNYNSSEWYEKSYKLLNKNYKIKKNPIKKMTDGLIKRTMKKILN